MFRVFDTDDDLIEAAQAQPYTLYDATAEVMHQQLISYEEEPISGYYTDGVRVLRMFDGGADDAQ